MAKNLKNINKKYYRNLLLSTDELTREEVMGMSLAKLKEYAEIITSNRRLSNAIAVVEEFGGVVTFPKRRG